MTGLQQTIEQYESDINELLEDLAYGWGDLSAIVAAIDNLLSQHASLTSQLALAEAAYEQAAQEHEAISQEVSRVGAELADDQAAIDAAQTALDTATAKFNYDTAELTRVRGELQQARTTSTAVEGVIENQEAIFQHQYDWLNNNPDYQTWVANGRPDGT